MIKSRYIYAYSVKRLESTGVLMKWWNTCVLQHSVVKHLCFAAFSGETLAVFNICSMEKQTVLISLNTAVVFYGIHGMGGYTITYCSTFVYLFTTSDCVCLLFLNSFIMVGKK